MKNKKKFLKFIIIGTVSSIVVASGLSVYFLVYHHYKGTEIIDEWHDSDVFDINKIKTVEKTPNKEFRILNFADIQLRDFNRIKVKKAIFSEMEYLIKTYQPDMITLTGDQTMCNYNLCTLRRIISFLDSYKIPYAPIFGNHDSGDEIDSATASTLKMCEMYEKGKYSLFSRGPSNLGSYGNYVVNIKEGDSIIRSLYFIDSGIKDTVSNNQREWVRWNSDGTKSKIGHYPESIVYTHMPFPEHRYAHLLRNTDENVYNYFSLSGSKQNGFFDMAKTRNFTDFICGHQHGNNFTLPYEGIRYTFAVKTGQTSCYYQDENINLNGCTIVRINKETTITHHYVEKGMFEFEDGENVAEYYKNYFK